MDSLVLNTLISENTPYDYKDNKIFISHSNSTSSKFEESNLTLRDVFDENVTYNVWTTPKIGSYYSRNSNKLIKLEGDFFRQLNFLKESLPEKVIDEKYYIYFFSKTIEEVLGVYPDNLTIELSYDDSIIYTAIKNNRKVYLEFLPFEESDEEKATLTYKDNGCLKSISGPINFILEKFVEKFASPNQTLFSFDYCTEVS